MVDPWHAIVIGAREAGQPKHGPLDGHRGVRSGELDHGRPCLAGQGAGLTYNGRVEVQLGRGTDGAHDRAPSRSKTVRPRMTVRTLVGIVAPGDRSGSPGVPVSYTHLTLPTNREV